MKIGLFTSVFFNNIGNGFIDLGAEATIKEALPNGGELVKLSQCANFAASIGKMFLLKEFPVVHWVWKKLMQKHAKNLQDKSYHVVTPLDVFSVAKIAKLDYFILPGCILTVPFFSIYSKLLEEKTKDHTKLIFLGVSGNFYNDFEIKTVKSYLKILHPYAIITRDSKAYSLYKDFADYSYNGIDNAFFVNRCGISKVETTLDPYIILNFEDPKHTDTRKLLASSHKNIIYTNHKPFPYSKVSRLVKQGIMVSDTPLDYLFLYANTTEIYSDRVHACIPTLAFGNKARLFSDSPRIALFENVGLPNITKELVCIDNLKIRQENQIAFLKSILK